MSPHLPTTSAFATGLIPYLFMHFSYELSFYYFSMLKSFDEPNQNKFNTLRPGSLKIPKTSNREENNDLRKTHSFSHNIKGQRRHVSTITAPDYAKLESPNDGSSIFSFSRNILRMSLGRDGKSKSCDSKLSPRSSPHSSKRSIFRRDKNSNTDLHDLEGTIPEDNRLTCQCSTSPRSTSTSQERIKMTPPVKDRRRKISLPTFLQSSHVDRGKPPSFIPYKTPNVEIEVFASPTGMSPPIGKICEANDDFLQNNGNSYSNDNLNSNNSNNGNNSSTNSNDDLSSDEYPQRQRFNSKTIKEQKVRGIDWSREEDWPKWQLEVVSSYTSPETTL